MRTLITAFLVAGAALSAPALTASASVVKANDRCPVTGLPVANHALYHYVMVKGHPYYVFDREAARRLRNAPAVYLGQDGTPVNASGLSRSCACAARR